MSEWKSSSASHTWAKARLVDVSASKKYSFVGGPFGSNLVSRDYKPYGVPVIRGTNLPSHCPFSFEDFVFVSEEKADKLFSNNAYPGDLIFTQRGTLGQIGLIPKNSPYRRFVISQSQMKLTVDEAKADSRFLYYYFRLPTTVEGIQNLALSSGIPHINLDILKKFEIPLPPLPVQKKIAAVLSAYDDLIENNDRRIALLEKMAEEIYREWFVRLRFPGHEQVTFHKGIPEGWKYIELGCLLDIKHGYAFKGEFFSQEPTSNVLLTPGNFAIGGGYKDDKLKYYNGSIPKDYILQAGDMIVTMTDLSKAGDTLGYPAFVPPSGEYQFLHNQRLGKVLIYDKKTVGSYFLYHVFCSELYRYHVVGSATGSTVKHTAPERIRSFQILLPHQALMQEFEKKIGVIRNQIVLLSRKNNLLKQTRDRLLTRLISGKLSVEDLDIQFPPSMTADP